ncbi:MAG: hypothetical protein OEY79_03515, partial [Anaplasmataceae bacterium]|nr:hypothetical protein [Anaplasmataceae bacterium]
IFFASSVLYSIFTLEYNKALQVAMVLCNGLCAMIITVIDSAIMQYIALEIISLCSIIIMYSNDNSIANRRNIIIYAILHFSAGTLILSGISGYCSSGIFKCTTNIYNIDDEIINIIITIGLLVNIASFPVSNWIFNYAHKSKISLLFLQLYSTKSGLIILNNFANNEKILIYFGILTTLYGLFNMFRYSSKINNHFLISYTLLQIGIIIIAIGCGSDIIPYLISSIVYQSLLYLLHVNKNRNIIYYIAIAIAISSSLGFPFTGSFLAKYMLVNTIDNNYIYWYITVMSYISAAYLSIIYFKTILNDDSIDDIRRNNKDNLVNDIIIIIYSIMCVIPITFNMEGYNMTSILKQMVFSLGFITLVNYINKNKYIKKYNLFPNIIYKFDITNIVIAILYYTKFWSNRVICYYRMLNIYILQQVFKSSFIMQPNNGMALNGSLMCIGVVLVFLLAVILIV